MQTEERRGLRLIGAYSTSIASIASFLASAYLLSALQGLPASSQKTLLARQLWHLALADLGTSVFEAIAVLLDFASLYGWTGDGLGFALKEWLCNVTYVLPLVGSEASLILECFLAVSSAAAIFKSRRALDVLSRALPLTWPLAVVLAVVAPLKMGIYWSGGTTGADACNGVDACTACDWTGNEWIFVASVVTTFVTCLVSYVVCSLCVRAAGAHVQTAVWARAGLYLLVALLVTLPYVLAQAHPFVSERGSIIWYNVTDTLYNLNGLLNFLVYTLQCRHSRRLFTRSEQYMVRDEAPMQREAPAHSFDVTFRRAASMRLVADLSAVVAANNVDSSDPDSYFEEMFSEELERLREATQMSNSRIVGSEEILSDDLDKPTSEESI